MRIYEVLGTDPEKDAADNLKLTAKRMNQQASAAQARLKVKKAQQQLVKAVQPMKPQQPMHVELEAKMNYNLAWQ